MARGWLAGAVAVVLSCATGCPTLPTVASGAPTPEVAVQRALAARLGFPVSLSVRVSTAHRDWVFLAGLPLTADGQRIDYRGTDYAQAAADGEFDDQFVALARRLPPPGVGWRVVELSLGTTDAPFVGWFEHHGLPLGLASPGAGATGR